MPKWYFSEYAFYACIAGTPICVIPWLGEASQHQCLAQRDPGTFPCGRPRCVTCAHTNPVQTLETPGGQIEVQERFTGTSSDLVYIISCRACHLCYIGETARRLGDRFREHQRSVRSNKDLPVAKHFSSTGHDAVDMLVHLYP